MKNAVYEERIRKVLAVMAESGLTQLLVSDPKGIWYLTGVWIEPYERMFAFLLCADGDHKLFLNRMFTVPETRHREIWYSDTDDAVALLSEQVDRFATLGVDKDWPARFLVPLLEKCPGMRVLVGSDCVDGVRACKDEAEREIMREASRINDETMEKAMAFIREGMTEKEVADYIGLLYRKAGCDGPSFTTIVSFGANAADPHHEPDGTVLKAGSASSSTPAASGGATART